MIIVIVGGQPAQSKESIALIAYLAVLSPSLLCFVVPGELLFRPCCQRSVLQSSIRPSGLRTPAAGQGQGDACGSLLHSSLRQSASIGVLYRCAFRFAMVACVASAVWLRIGRLGPVVLAVICGL